MRDESEADSDAEPSPVRHSGATQPTERSAISSSDSASDSASDSDSDAETLGARGVRHRAAAVAKSGQSHQHRASPISKHKPHRRSGPASYCINEASLPDGTARQQHRQLGRSEHLGDEDSVSEGARTDSGYDSMDDFIVPDDDTGDTDEDDDVESSSSGDGSSAGAQSSDGDNDEDAGHEDAEAQGSSNQATQLFAPVVANSPIMMDPPSPKQFRDFGRTARDDHQQETQPYAPWESPLSTPPLANDDDVVDLTEGEPLSNLPRSAVPTPPSSAEQLIAGRRRLCKRPQQS